MHGFLHDLKEVDDSRVPGRYGSFKYIAQEGQRTRETCSCSMAWRRMWVPITPTRPTIGVQSPVRLSRGCTCFTVFQDTELGHSVHHRDGTWEVPPTSTDCSSHNRLVEAVTIFHKSPSKSTTSTSFHRLRYFHDSRCGRHILLPLKVF